MYTVATLVCVERFYQNKQNMCDLALSPKIYTNIYSANFG